MMVRRQYLSSAGIPGEKRLKTLFRRREVSMSILIKDTTKEEREKIVADSLGNINGSCDGCASGLVEMYQDYIDGKRELREINMAFRRGYVSGADGPEKQSCGYGV